jgi:apoptosis-inducing factor 2
MKIEGASRKQGVVVVGGSFAGLCTIRHLKKYEDLDITLVEPKDYFEYTPGALHLLSGSKGDLLSPLADILKDSAAVVHGKFVGVSKAADTKSIVVKLIDDDLGHSTLTEVPYDALIICSGVPYTAPIRAASVLGPTLVNRLMEVDDYNKKLKGATRVIISGGGLVGVELAAEISCRLENQVKEVLLISRTTLLGSLPKEAGNLALKWLNKRKNIKLYLGDEIVGTPFKEGSNSNPTSSSAARGDRLNCFILEKHSDWSIPLTPLFL